VRVYVGTTRVTVDLLAGRRRQLVRGVTLPIGPPAASAGESGAAALDTLAEALEALQAETGHLHAMRCDVVLADAWIVYDVVPVDVVRIAPAAAELAIGAALADVAGVPAQDLAVRWQEQDDGRAAFAMAMPRELLARLSDLLRAYGLSVASMTGEFVSVFNAQRRSLTGRRAVLAVGREAGAQIAVLVDGAICATRFELGRAPASALSQAAAGAMRARGEDTTAPVDYVLDAAGAVEQDDDRWVRVQPPAWAAAMQAGAAGELATAVGDAIA
jgi:hypothetical protein